MYDFTEGLQKDQNIGAINLVLQTWKRRQEVCMADTGRERLSWDSESVNAALSSCAFSHSVTIEAIMPPPLDFY